MKLKEIPADIVVHTPTEGEARELLAILHESGYKCGWSLTNEYECKYFVIYQEFEIAICLNGSIANSSPILTLTEFKERFCLEDKPQPKFRVGDVVRWGGRDNIYIIEESNITYKIRNSNGLSYSYAKECDLTPCTESETKPTENMETKDEAKELSLCELLKGHEGETFYSPCYGIVELTTITPRIEIQGVKKHSLSPKGSHHSISDGQCMLFPSRALYEQYPLDPYTAWMKWQEEQKKYILQICYAPLLPDDIKLQAQQTMMADLSFRTPADRDKCIGEIKAIIEKYSKKRNIQ